MKASIYYWWVIRCLCEKILEGKWCEIDGKGSIAIKEESLEKEEFSKERTIVSQVEKNKSN